MARSSGKRGLGHGHTRTALFVVEAIGLCISVFLLLISTKIIYKEGAPCPRGAIFACHSLLQGAASKLNFTIPGLGAKTIPIALLGVVYFLWQLVLTFLMRERWLRILKWVSIVAGLAFVAWLRGLEIVTLHKICPWCYAVALATIIEAIVCYPVVMGPVPQWLARIATVLMGFLLMVLAAAALVYAGGIKLGQIAESEEPPAKVTPKPISGGGRDGQKQTSGTAGMTARKPPKAASKGPKPAVAEAVPETAETRILKAHDWKLVSSEDQIEKMLPAEAPIVLFVYDPECGECQAFTHGELQQREMALPGVTKVAIDEAKLDGPLSSKVQNVPTLLVIDAQRNVRFKQEGRPKSLSDFVINLQGVLY